MTKPLSPVWKWGHRPVPSPLPHSMQAWQKVFVILVSTVSIARRGPCLSPCLSCSQHTFRYYKNNFTITASTHILSSFPKRTLTLQITCYLLKTSNYLKITLNVQRESTGSDERGEGLKQGLTQWSLLGLVCWPHDGKARPRAAAPRKGSRRITLRHGL